MKVVQAPRSTECGATNEGEPDEFEEQYTMPPSWLAECAFCKCRVRCFPSPFMARAAGTQAQAFAEQIRISIVREIMES
jgi:hypothetical protein